MESALKLGDMGYKVLVVEKEASDRRQDDPAQQGLPDARLRQLHLDAEDGAPPPITPT